MKDFIRIDEEERANAKQLLQTQHHTD